MLILVVLGCPRFLPPAILGRSLGKISGTLKWATLGKDQKGLHKRGIHDQGDFWKFLLETTV